MTSSTEHCPFRELARELRAIGCVEHAAAIEDVLSSAWTSSSEYLGELGQAVLSYKRSGAPMPEAVVPLVKVCMQEVRQVWPDIGK